MKKENIQFNLLLINNLNSFNMIALLIMTIWTLCFTMAVTKIENLGINKWWKGGLFFLLAPIISIVVLVGWGVTGYMSDDWENLM